ncbi:MAG: hypothetical protein LBE83_03845 [Propionibacteriaceae bacterium]|jgi:hypothetical protein|nr:hypothetical protein [Propionibacteriaceae bacterium]
MLRTRLLASLVALVVLVGGAGCSQSPKVAAVVNDQVITMAALQTSAGFLLESEDMRGLLDWALNWGAIAKSDPTGVTLSLLITSALINQSLDKLDSPLTPESRAQLWGTLTGQTNADWTSLRDDRRAAAIVDALLDQYLVSGLFEQEVVDRDVFFALFYIMPVEVNPRYGVWDAQSMTVSTRVDGLSAGPLADRTSFTMP